MPRPKIDLSEKIRSLLDHVEMLPPEAVTPLAHFRRSSADLWNLLNYIERKFSQVDLYQQSANRHLSRLHRMLLADLIENFERFLKELAATCVNHLAPFILDDRFNTFRIHGSALAAHFGTDTLGKSLCESATWLDCKEVNSRFRDLLADPYDEGKFHIFPNSTAAEKEMVQTLSLIWQLRHTSIHNVGVVTQSDAVKLRLLSRRPVNSPRVLTPTRDDVRYLSQFLDERAVACNVRVGSRLSELLGTIHTSDPTLFDPKVKADSVSSEFGAALTIAGFVGNPAS